SDRLEGLVERLPGEILYAILRWVGAGQDGCMRRPSERHLRDGMLEDNPVASQGVQCGRLDVRRTIAAEVIGAYRIDGNEDHVRGNLAGRNRGCQATRGQES